MGLRTDLKTLSTYADNPYDAKYRPEKEMRRLCALLLISLPIFLGLCCQFWILVAGPLSIYWFVTYFNALGYMKALGWKRWKFVLPTVVLAIFGLYLAFTNSLVEALGWFFTEIVFFK